MSTRSEQASGAEPIQIFIAPSERHTAMQGIADRISNLPEKYGCDAIWRARGEWWGVQRKEVSDFFNSVQDGRLAKEVGQMQGHVSIPIVCIEGKMSWTIGGELCGNGYGATVTKQQFHGMIFSMALKGVTTLFSDRAEGTAELIKNLAVWSQKENHNSLDRRPGPQTPWGRSDNMDWAKHLLQGFPGIGAGVAADIIKHFGRVPLKWDITEKELLAVKGIGKERAKALLEAFNAIDP